MWEEKDLPAGPWPRDIVELERDAAVKTYDVRRNIPIVDLE